jgi:hypothetical protein
MTSIVALYKKLNILKEELIYWEKYQPVNNMGKWSRSVRLESINKKIQKVQEELKRRKTQIKNDDK